MNADDYGKRALTTELVRTLTHERGPYLRGLQKRGEWSAEAQPTFLSSNTSLGGLTAKIVVREAGDERGLVSSAVFKTVCGALLRRPGWVRFPSIPAKFGGW